MDKYFKIISQAYKDNSDKKLSEWQKNYMRGQFDFYGVPSQKRNEILKPFLKETLFKSFDNLKNFVKTCWNDKYREMQYAAMHVVRSYVARYGLPEIELAEFMITNKSWWDTVDFIAPSIAEKFFASNHDLEKEITLKWLNSGNLWLRRSAVIYQLKRKQKTDTFILIYNIKKLADDNEFFIQKAIGWALREYSKVNPQFVIEQTAKLKISNLAKREALRYLKKKGKFF